MKNPFRYISLLPLALILTACPAPSQDPDPGPTPEQGDTYDFTVYDGVRDWTREKSKAYAEFKIVKTEDNLENVYTLTWWINDDTSAKGEMSSVYSGRTKTLSFPSDDVLPCGLHVFHVDVALSGGKVESLQKDFYVKGNDINSSSATVTDATGKCQELSRDKAVTIASVSSGQIEIRYTPAATIPVFSCSVAPEGIITLDSGSVKLEEGAVTVPYRTTGKSGALTFSYTLANGAKEHRDSCLMVADGTVVTDTQNITVPSDFRMDAGRQSTVKLSVEPEGALDGYLLSAVSSDESVVRVVSYEGLELALEGEYVGAAIVSVTVGKVTKSFPVTVEGKAVTDLSVESSLAGAKIPIGQSVTGSVVPFPEDAFDAGTVTVTSSAPSVISVTPAGGYMYTFSALSFGSAVMTAAVRGAQRQWTMSCTETLSVKESYSARWGETVDIIVNGQYKDFSVSCQAPDGVTVTKIGSAVRIRNLAKQAASLAVTLTTSVTLTSASFAVQLAGPDGNVSSDVSWEGSGASYVFTLTMTNGTLSPVQWKQAAGYICSCNVTSEEQKRLLDDALDAESHPAEVSDAGGVFARLVDFLPGGAVSVPAADISEKSVTLGHDSDDYGTYTSPTATLYVKLWDTVNGKQVVEYNR